MNLPLSDLIDRYSIELRKDHYGHGNPEMVEELAAEIVAHLTRRSQNHLPMDVFSMIHASVRLGLANADIANLEWQMRGGVSMSYEEMGRRAQAIRRINDNGRVKARQELSRVLKENVETRHYGYGADVKAEGLTLDIQEPAAKTV